MYNSRQCKTVDDVQQQALFLAVIIIKGTESVQILMMSIHYIDIYVQYINRLSVFTQIWTLLQRYTSETE